MTGIPELPPAFLLIAGALLLPVLPAILRSFVTVAFPLVALGCLVQFDHGTLLTAGFAGFELVLLQVSNLNFVFGVIFLLISAIASLYAWHIRDVGQQVAAMLYGAGAIGATLAGDLLTLLLFWELMAVSSAWLVFARGRADSTAAGFRYLMVHFVGGSILFGGIVLLYAQTGSLLLNALTPDQGLGAWLILLGVCVNAAVPPLHPWLPDAYPKATITGAIFMSALTTKTAVYILLVLFPGWDILIYAGLVMTLYGVVYAVLVNDIRQILAYHIISQVGYMVTGIGIGTALSLNGTAAHAYSHILYKALLFAGAGAVIYTTGKSKLTELGNLRKHTPVIAVLFMVGAFSIAGFPLFNGFISKSIIVSAAGEAHHPIVMLGLHLASVGTFLSIGLKIPAFAFWGPERNLEIRPLPRTMYAAMGVLALLCIFYGLFPGPLYRILPFDVPYHPFTAYHFVESGQILIFSFLAFWVLRMVLVPKAKLNLDTDWLYRRGAPWADRLVVGPVVAFFEGGVTARGAIANFVSRRFANPQAWFNPFRRSVDLFNPDRERGPLGASIGWAILFIVLITVLAANV